MKKLKIYKAKDDNVHEGGAFPFILLLLAELLTAGATGGSRGVAVYRKGKHKYYFDSYGIQPMKEAMDFLEHGTYSTFLIQPENTKICGQLCLHILYKLN